MMIRHFSKILLAAAIVLVFSEGSFGAGPLKAAIDPTDMGVGARPFGLGRAYSGIADDANSIFLNPAGLSHTKRWEMTSMYSNLLGEVNYTLLGVSMPMGGGDAVGLGYVGANVGDSQIISHRDPSTGRIVPTDEGAIGYLSSAFIISYGGTLKRFVPLDYFDNVYWGTSFKIFDQELSGGPSPESASGSDMDLGVQVKVLPWLRLGAFGSNILSYSSGGVLRWTSGIEEDIPFAWKAGFFAKVLGWDAPWEFGDTEMYLTYDSEMSMKRPGLNHFGAEVWPLEYLALRFGIDQDAVDSDGGIGVDNNLTAGIGFYWNEIEFDYAFHQFGSLTENNTHFFSISFGITREKRPEVVKAAPPKTKFINAIYPSTEVVVFAEDVMISGEVEPEVSLVKLGAVTAEAAGGKFSVWAPVEKIGKNPFKLEVFNNGGRLLEEAKIKVLRLPSFSDVAPDYWDRLPIAELSALSIILGYPDGSFRPEGNITRAELATLIIRTGGEKLPLVTEKKLFKDLTGDHWAAQFIKEGVLKGVVKGYPDGTFRPSNNINRAEGTAVIARYDGIEEEKVIYEKPFADIPARHWAIGIIAAAKNKGLLEFLEGKEFQPAKNLTRAEAVEVISKASFARKKIEGLLDWSTGY